MLLIDFLDSRGIKWCPIESLDIKDGKLPATPYTQYINDFSWNYMRNLNTFNFLTNDQLDELKQVPTEYIVVDTSKIHQIDIDNPNSNIYIDTPYYLSCHKKLPHYFVKYDPPPDMPFFGKVQPYEGDYLSGLGTYAHRDQEVFNFDKPIAEINIYDYTKCEAH